MARILVIDDGQEFRRLVTNVLAHDGHQVVEAGSGEQGLRLLTETLFDVVITDIFMPGTDGLQVIRWLRTTNHAARIIAISGGRAEIDMDILEVARTMGADATLKKPFPLTELSNAVQQLIGPS